MKIFKLLQSARHNVPLEIMGYWQAFYIDFNSDGRLLHGGRPIKFSNSAKVGDEVPLIEKDRKRHVYKVVGISYAPGDDHIVSPKHFDLEYVRSIAVVSA